MGFLFFVVYLFFEILVSYLFIQIFTPLGFFLESVVTAIIGILLLRDFSISMLWDIQLVVNREITPEEFISIGILRFVGAIFLIMPGILTDILGTIFQFPWTGQWFASHFLKSPTSTHTHFHHSKEPDIIDAEIIEEEEKSLPPFHNPK
jgi:UPF0716 family protein affecting phage T7 exclusion